MEEWGSMILSFLFFLFPLLYLTMNLKSYPFVEMEMIELCHCALRPVKTKENEPAGNTL